MSKQTLPEDTSARLNREMWRESLGGWKATLGVVVLVAVFTLAFIRIPTDTQYKQGEVTGTMTLATEGGPRQVMGVLVDGENYSAGLRARLLHPAKGETVCLRQTRYWPLGQTTYNLTDMRFCGGAITTPTGE